MLYAICIHTCSASSRLSASGNIFICAHTPLFFHIFAMCHSKRPYASDPTLWPQTHLPSRTSYPTSQKTLLLEPNLVWTLTFTVAPTKDHRVKMFVSCLLAFFAKLSYQSEFSRLLIGCIVVPSEHSACVT